MTDIPQGQWFRWDQYVILKLQGLLQPIKEQTSLQCNQEYGRVSLNVSSELSQQPVLWDVVLPFQVS